MRGRHHRAPVALVLLLLAAVAATAGTSAVDPGEVPLGFPEVPVPDRYPLTPELVQLGERLFFETRLSSDGTVSCGSCHRPELYFTDGLPKSRGVEEQEAEKNAPSVLNTGYYPNLMSDGRSPDLEDQVRYPVIHPREMNLTQDDVVDILEADPSYLADFEQAFGRKGISFERVTRALAAFQRTLVSGNSPFDRFYFGGDESALSESARRGWELFKGPAGCIECHSFNEENPFFSDFSFHNTGVGFSSEPPDLGRFHLTKERADKGLFRTLPLRNVAETAPYMSNGFLPTLEEVVDFYAGGGLDNPFLDERIKPLDLDEEDRAALVAFLESLTGEYDYTPPEPLDPQPGLQADR